MPSLELDDNQALYQIKAYQPGQIRINQTIFTTSVIIAREDLISDWSPQTIHELTSEALKAILPLNPDLVLIGTGSTLIWPSPSIYSELTNRQIGVEIMNTHAACRTFNALTAENRRVVAALFL